MFEYQSFAVSKFETGNRRVLDEPSDLRQQLCACAKHYAPVARRKSIILSTFTDDDVPQVVMLDRLRVHQLLLNRIGDAVKRTDRGGVDVEARVEERFDGSTLLLSVLDTGSGIQPDRLNDILTPYMQEDGSVVQRYAGIDLSLAACSQLVTMMGGRIAVHSKRNVGNNFAIRLPLKEVANDDLGISAAQRAYTMPKRV